jgi:hypothetical protein
MAINYHNNINISHIPLLLSPPPDIAPFFCCHLSLRLAVAIAILLLPVALLPSAVAASTAAAC